MPLEDGTQVGVSYGRIMSYSKQANTGFTQETEITDTERVLVLTKALQKSIEADKQAKAIAAPEASITLDAESAKVLGKIKALL